mmetsp:Transcript_56890/g.118958  ORF Transcript_56890/g.118958 Transcript_56890/m.118958 type:complete len:88 (+) Transcript_56890:428-691(+)
MELVAYEMLVMAAKEFSLRTLPWTRWATFPISNHSPSAVPGSPVIDNQLWGNVDSEWAVRPDTRRSTSGYVLVLNGAAVFWRTPNLL